LRTQQIILKNVGKQTVDGAPIFFPTMETIRKVTTSDLEVWGCILKHFILPLSSPKWQSKFFVKSFLLNPVHKALLRPTFTEE